MKFYDCATAPSPQRVRIFLAEKGLTVPTVQVDLRKGEQFRPEFRAINPDCTVPVLVLDDGTTITDAIGICVYFEAVQPRPALFGESATEKAVITAWQRIAERDGFYAVMEAFRNATPGLKDRGLPGPDAFEQIPALAERGQRRLDRFFQMMDARLDEHEFVAGSRFSIADITTLVTVGFAGWIKKPIPQECHNLRRWHVQVAARPSAKA